MPVYFHSPVICDKSFIDIIINVVIYIIGYIIALWSNNRAVNLCHFFLSYGHIYKYNKKVDFRQPAI